MNCRERTSLARLPERRGLSYALQPLETAIRYDDLADVFVISYYLNSPHCSQ